MITATTSIRLNVHRAAASLNQIGVTYVGLRRDSGPAGWGRRRVARIDKGTKEGNGRSRGTPGESASQKSPR